jgi:predicted amidohydrolase
MQDLRVSLAQIAPKLGDPEANLGLHLDAIENALREGSDLVVFPELSLTGYHLLDQVPDVALQLESGLLASLRGASADIDIVAGFVEEAPGHRFHNAAAYFSRGRLTHVHRKLFLPNYGMFQEGRDFAPGERLRGFDAPHGPCGMLICEDLWHPTCAWLLAQEGVETILVLSNGPTRGARPERQITSISVWRELTRVTARFQTVFAVYVNRVGCEDGLSFGGGSLVVDPFGRVVAEAPALEENLLTVDLEGESLRRARTTYPLLRDENLELAYRELGRIRRRRFGLQQEGHHGTAGAGEEKGELP